MAALMAAKPIGGTTELIAEATDCAHSETCVLEDGKSGDIDFPYANIKVIATMGEIDAKTGYMLVGVPDGMGSYLLDDETIRFVYQSESYGPINWFVDALALLEQNRPQVEPTITGDPQPLSTSLYPAAL